MIEEWINEDKTFDNDLNPLAEKHDTKLVRDEECLESLEKLKLKFPTETNYTIK